MSAKHTGLPPLIAIVGCDGSGKSSVSEAILTWVSDYGPAARVHLGKQSGNIGRALVRLPLIGKWFGRVITRKADHVRHHRGKDKTPDIFPALVISVFTLRRLLRFRRMLALRRRGFIIIADRYPQLDLPGGFDGPGLSAAAKGNGFVYRLAQREQAAFEWMTRYRPDLVIRLNVDLDTACARKPDHRREALARKIAFVPLLTFKDSLVVDVDASQSLADVLAAAKGAVIRTLTEHGYAAPPSSHGVTC